MTGSRGGKHRRTPEDTEGQVSEVSGLHEPETPIAPEDATAGYPDSESGHPQEGTAGPNAPPERDRPTPEGKRDDD